MTAMTMTSQSLDQLFSETDSAKMARDIELMKILERTDEAQKTRKFATKMMIQREAELATLRVMLRSRNKSIDLTSFDLIEDWVYFHCLFVEQEDLMCGIVDSQLNMIRRGVQFPKCHCAMKLSLSGSR